MQSCLLSSQCKPNRLHEVREVVVHRHLLILNESELKFVHSRYCLANLRLDPPLAEKPPRLGAS